MTPIEEQKLQDALRQKHQHLDVQQFSSPVFTSPTGDPLALAKGPPVIPEEHKEFVENIWFVNIVVNINNNDTC